MYKSKFSELNLSCAQVLTRDELKQILGGQTAPPSGCSCSCSCSGGGSRNISISNCSQTCTATDDVGAYCGQSGESCATACKDPI